jgi:hypothetical protein
MAAPRKRPSSICRRRFRPNPRVGARQHACGLPEYQMSRCRKTHAILGWELFGRGRLPFPLSFCLTLVMRAHLSSICVGE